MNKAHLTNNTGLHPDNKNWKEYLENWSTFNFEYHGYKVYNSVNCWYLVDSEGNVNYDIFGYHVWHVLGELTNTDIGEVRNTFDTLQEFKDSILKDNKKWHM